MNIALRWSNSEWEFMNCESCAIKYATEYKPCSFILNVSLNLDIENFSELKLNQLCNFWYDCYQRKNWIFRMTVFVEVIGIGFSFVEYCHGDERFSEAKYSWVNIGYFFEIIGFNHLPSIYDRNQPKM